MNKEKIKHDIINSLNLIAKRNIVVWGASNGGSLVFETLKELGYEVKCFVDSNKEKQKSLFKEKPVKDPDFLDSKSNNYYVYLAMNYNLDVINRLNQMGYVEKKDYFSAFPDYIDNIKDYVDSKNNQIIGFPSFIGSKVFFQGSGNKLVFGSRVLLSNATIIFSGNNGYCYIGDESTYQGFIRIGSGCKVTIGKKLHVTINCLISTSECTEVTIGDDCMFASNNQIRTDDGHPIFDVETGKRTNLSKSITIGNHVWLAYGAALLSGASVKDGSVIGFNSIVKSVIPNNCIAVGAPARVVRKNIAWDKKSLFKNEFVDEAFVRNKQYWNYTQD